MSFATEMRFYVYQHRRGDTGAVFYVGKGTERKRSKSCLFERSRSTLCRNAHWRRVVARHGFTVEIVALCRTDEEAQNVERALIREYGRANLTNMTDGGEGHAGLVVTPETRERLAAMARRPRTAAWVESIRKARANGGNGGVVKKGDKLPESWREAIARGQLGPNNYMRGRTGAASPNRRSVVNTLTGETFPTVTAAANALGLRLQTLHNMLTGFRVNTTSLRFA